MAKRKKIRGAGRARPVTNINATVVATGGAPKPVTYRLEAGDMPSRRYVTGPREITIPESQDLYRIHFRLDDRGCSQNLRFRRRWPICAHNDTECPMDGGITTVQLKRSGAVEDKRLVINDYNSAKGSVGFALFFRDQRTNAPVNEFDPIIENGGGGIPG